MENAVSNSKPKRFHWLLAVPLTLWCVIWLLSNGYNYITLTWHLFRSLKWWSFGLVISPCFWIWFGFFSSAVWAPLNLSFLSWDKYNGLLVRTKIFLMILFFPFIMGVALQYIGPYFYPILPDGEYYSLRFIPIFGGKGYVVDGHEITW